MTSCNVRWAMVHFPSEIDRVCPMAPMDCNTVNSRVICRRTLARARDRENFARLGSKSYLVNRQTATGVPRGLIICFRFPCTVEGFAKSRSTITLNLATLHVCLHQEGRHWQTACSLIVRKYKKLSGDILMIKRSDSFISPVTLGLLAGIGLSGVQLNAQQQSDPQQ